MMQYTPLSKTLEEAGVGLPLSELHGGLCGLLCAAGVGAADAWLQESIGGHDARAQTAAQELRTLQFETWGELAGSDMQFAPLIPEDDRALEERVDALAEWCHGFLSGLGLGGVALSEDATEQVREIVGDLAEISRAGLSAEERDNETESDFVLTELVEYVRVGVQIVFEELEDLRAESTVHGRGH